MSQNKNRMRSRVLIVDDHSAVREALASRIGLQRDLEVCGEAADIGEALRLVAGIPGTPCLFLLPFWFGSRLESAQGTAHTFLQPAQAGLVAKRPAGALVATPAGPFILVQAGVQKPLPVGNQTEQGSDLHQHVVLAP
jgi:hypothetical protein